MAGPSLRETLAVEAHFLATTLAELLPEEPEALGLAALVSLSLARAEARHSANEFIPLDAQDASTWDERLIQQGESYRRRAFALARIGRFQLEAAIQSAHCASRDGGSVDLNALRRLYEGLIAVAPSLGARTALAATIGQIEGPEAGLRELDSIVHAGIGRFHPAWATRAHLLAAAGHHQEACEAFEKAISLTTEPKLRTYLLARRQESAGQSSGSRSHPKTP